MVGVVRESVLRTRREVMVGVVKAVNRARGRIEVVSVVCDVMRWDGRSDIATGALEALVEIMRRVLRGEVVAVDRLVMRTPARGAIIGALTVRMVSGLITRVGPTGASSRERRSSSILGRHFLVDQGDRTHGCEGDVASDREQATRRTNQRAIELVR